MSLSESLRNNAETLWENKWTVLGVAVVGGVVYCVRESLWSLGSSAVSRVRNRCNCDDSKKNN